MEKFVVVKSSHSKNNNNNKYKHPRQVFQKLKNILMGFCQKNLLSKIYLTIIIDPMKRREVGIKIMVEIRVYTSANNFTNICTPKTIFSKRNVKLRYDNNIQVQIIAIDWKQILILRQRISFLLLILFVATLWRVSFIPLMFTFSSTLLSIFL